MLVSEVLKNDDPLITRECSFAKSANLQQQSCAPVVQKGRSSLASNGRTSHNGNATDNRYWRRAFYLLHQWFE